MRPWSAYPEMKPDHARGDSGWNLTTHPFLVTWTIALPDRLTRSTSHVRAFASLAEAHAAYIAPAQCWQVRLERCDSMAPVGAPGVTLAKRRPTKPKSVRSGSENERRRHEAMKPRLGL